MIDSAGVNFDWSIVIGFRPARLDMLRIYAEVPGMNFPAYAYGANNMGRPVPSVVPASPDGLTLGAYGACGKNQLCIWSPAR